MLLDERLEFCDANSLLVPNGTAATWKVVGDVIDLGAPGFGGVANITNFVGDGTPMFFVAQISTRIITAGTAGTVQFFLQSDDAAAITPTTASTHINSQILITDDATALDVGVATGNIQYVHNQIGQTFFCQALPMHVPYERFLGVTLLISTTDITAGAINAFLTRDPYRYRMYQDSLASGS